MVKGDNRGSELVKVANLMTKIAPGHLKKAKSAIPEKPVFQKVRFTNSFLRKNKAKLLNLIFCNPSKISTFHESYDLEFKVG